MKFLLAAISLFALTSCGGGGGGGGGAPSGGAPATSSFNGVAVDGYLYQARAFLDLNGNGQYDNGEPTATTDANGGFTLSATQDQINSHSVVVSAIAGTTIDQDNPNTPLSSGMTLIAPAGNPSVVSPLTTQVAAKVANGLSLDAAKSAVQTELGLTSVDVMKNYVAEKVTNPAYADAHKVAVSVAVVLKDIESQSSSNTTLSAKLSALQAKVTEVVTPNLVTIKQASLITSSSGSSSSGSSSSGSSSSGSSSSGSSSSGSSSSGSSSSGSSSSGSSSSGSSSSGSSSSGSSSSGSSSPADVVANLLSQELKIYSIGGSISGLNATGLVLANGVGTVSPTSDANSFTFATKSAAGGSYAVTVQSNPRGQICTVSNGTGTVGSRSITNISVSCANAPGALGGTITGLTTSGLVLKNGSDELTVTSGSSTFQFSSTVADGAAYSVTVKTQPTGKTCSLSNGAGNMSSSGVTSVQVTCSANAYTLGGSISGLSASGLKLKNGSDVLTVSSGATSFVLGTPVAYGGSYSVSVDTQPSGYTCSLSNANGTMGAANVTAVQVTCAVNAYTLGGSISGLSAAGLKLKNGSDVLTVSSGATSFVFTTQVAYGGSYSVEIDTQPSGKTCSLSNANGTMGAANVSAIQVSCINSYTVGGSISGLSASGLVLKNGTEVLTVNSGATNFVFSSRVNVGANYAVTIDAQPDALACTISNSTANNVNQDITNIDIVCVQRFVKLGASGELVADNSASWACTKDNRTGLYWETKSDLNKESTYTNYRSIGRIDRYLTVTSEMYFSPTNSAGYGKSLSDINYCGGTGWGVPSKDQLLELVTFDTKYFPNLSGEYWSYSLNPYGSPFYVIFPGGRVESVVQTDFRKVIMMR